MKTGAGETFANRIVWQSCYNKSGQTIPPFSVVMATDWSLPDMSGIQTASPYLDVKQPDGTGAPWNHYITWEVAIPPNSFGACARPGQTPLIALLAGGQTGSSDAPFRLCGPQSGQWTLTRDAPGFVMLAQPQSGYALVMPSRGPYAGQLPANTSTTTGSVKITTFIEPFSGTSSGTASSVTVACWNPYANIDTTQSGANLRVTFDWVGGQWELIAADPCPPGNSDSVGGSGS